MSHTNNTPGHVTTSPTASNTNSDSNDSNFYLNIQGAQQDIHSDLYQSSFLQQYPHHYTAPTTAPTHHSELSNVSAYFLPPIQSAQSTPFTPSTQLLQHQIQPMIKQEEHTGTTMRGNTTENIVKHEPKVEGESEGEGDVDGEECIDDENHFYHHHHHHHQGTPAYQSFSTPQVNVAASQLAQQAVQMPVISSHLSGTFPQQGFVSMDPIQGVVGLSQQPMQTTQLLQGHSPTNSLQQDFPQQLMYSSGPSISLQVFLFTTYTKKICFASIMY